MTTGPRTNWISLAWAPMKSGKSNWLFTRLNTELCRNRQVVYYKVSLKVSEPCVCESESHSGMSFNGPSSFYIPPEFDFLNLNIRGMYDVFGIEEVQFLSTQSVEQIVVLSEKFGKRVYATGLDLDFKARPFVATSMLAAFADETEKPHESKCTLCGKEARYSYRISGGHDQNEEDESGKNYVPLCKVCYISVVDQHGLVGGCIL